MSQKMQSDDESDDEQDVDSVGDVTFNDDDRSYSEIRDEMMTTKGVERSALDVADDEHALAGMESKREAPVEAVAKNVVERYDEISAFLREYMSNAHTACIQRAKYELREAGITDVNFNDVREVLDTASEELGYEPVITIVRNENPDDFSLKIMDNGIGISRERAYAIRDIGLSGWHDDGTTNGMFGQGTMSGFLPVDHWGEFDMTTMSVKTDENYRARWKLTDLDKIPGKRDSYGTTFTFPYFIDEAKQMDTYEKVREYAEGMIVPVIYEHYDANGEQDGVKSDDWGASYIESRYADDSTTIVYEDDYGKAVWSPDDPDGWNTNLGTWCGYQPIDRNGPGFGINSYSMPSGFDIRVKVEDGSIVSVPDDADDSMVGKIPVSRNRYEHLPDEKQDGHVVRSEVPDDAIVAPQPTDDRDRFESKHVAEYMRYYSQQLEAELKSRVASVIESIDGLEDLPDIDSTERELLLVGIDEYIDVYKKNDADRLQDDIEDEFGVRPDSVLASNIGVIKSEFNGSINDEFAKAVGQMRQARLGSVDDEDSFGETVREMTNTVSVAPRNAYNYTKKSSRSSVEVWDIVQRVGDDGTVFMAKTLSCKRKVELAWELHEDNEVVVVDSYTKWEDTFDWQKLKDLPSRNFEKAFPNFDFSDGFIDQHDPSSGSTSNTSSSDLDGLSFDDKRAQKRDVTVRYDSGHGNFDALRGSELFTNLDNGDPFTINFSTGFDTLVLYRSTDHNTSAGRHVADKSRGIAYAVVPNYVYDYLIDAENAYSEADYIEQQREKWVDFDWSDSSLRGGDTIGDMDEQDVFVKASSALLDPINDRDLMDEFVAALEDSLDSYDIDGVRSITFKESMDEHFELLNKNGCIDATASDSDQPTLVEVATPGYGSSGSFGYGYARTTRVGVESMFFDCVLPELDRDAVEWNHFDPSMDDDELIDALQDLQDDGGFVSTDDDTEMPEHLQGEYGLTHPSTYWISQTLDRMNDATDLLEDDV
jgi:hypothetical protein